MINNKSPKIAKEFLCEKCNYICCKQSDFNKHLLTAKHKRIINDNKMSQKIAIAYSCLCGKTYKFASGLSRHKQKCSTINNNNNNYITTQENLEEKPSIMDIITQNKEIMDVLVLQNEQLMKKNNELTNTIQEMIPKIGNNNNNTNNFNLQVFLNEDCKDAINFSEFIENITITFEDLEHQAQVGYVNGVSKLFIENLRELGTHKRPIHCTDKKRKTIYIKENNEWDKEGSQDTLKKGIREVSRKGFECLMKEKQENQEVYYDVLKDISE